MMMMKKKISCSEGAAAVLLLIFVILATSCCSCAAVSLDEVVVKREQRRTLVSTENGDISAARVVDPTINASYLLHWFTLDPNSLFLPVILHADMLFYVHTGSGKLTWMEEDEVKTTYLRQGDVHRLEEGAIFLVHSNLDTDSDRQKLRIHTIFPNSDKYTHEIGPYSSIRDMILGFDNKILQAAFKVPVEKIEELVNGTKPPAIIHAPSAPKNRAWEMEVLFIERLFGSTTSNNIFEINKKKKKEKEKKKDKDDSKLFNLFKGDKDVQNCHGWSTAVTSKKMPALTGTNIGLFMVNLTEGSMMGPHWNPMATEIAVVLRGRGMVRVVCPGNAKETGCKNMRYKVEEGDTFVVPRFHTMAQMAFNNDTLVFMGFSTSANRNHPQYLAGQASVLRTLDKDVLAVAFNVTNTTMDQVINSQKDSVMLGCISCAEEELKVVEEEVEKEKAEEREREGEEARKREEEERREEWKREEEEAARQEEERERREEEEGEEAARKAEEERRRQEAKREEKERERQEKEAREREEAARREAEEEEAAREREERKREEEEEAAAARRAKEEEEAREREERKKQEEEEAARTREREERKRQEEEEERKRQEEEAAASRRRQEEEEAARRAEEERKREEEEAREREEAEEEEARERAEEEQRKAEEERTREEEAGGRRRRRRRRREGEEMDTEEEAAAAEEERTRQEREEEEEAPPTWPPGLRRLIHLFPTQAHYPSTRFHV